MPSLPDSPLVRALAGALLDDEEIEQLVMALARARHAKGRTFTEADALQLVSWAREITFWSFALDAVFHGLADLDLDEYGHGVLVHRRQGEQPA